MIFETHIPTEPLNGFIDCFIYFKDYTPSYSVERIVPDASLYLVIELDGQPRHELDNTTHERKHRRTGAWISGLHTDYITIDALPESEMFVVRFKTYGAYPFLHKPLAALNNKVWDADKVMGEGVLSFREELKSLHDPQEKMRVSERWLLSIFEESRAAPEWLQSACNKIAGDPSFEETSLQSLIEQSGFSKKHFIDQFKQYAGFTPKQYHRVVRFNDVLQSIQRGEEINWAQLALQSGYYDQSHFIREFLNFSGIGPSDFLKRYKGAEEINFLPVG
jgi:AraC-like DNA-binding protein